MEKLKSDKILLPLILDKNFPTLSPPGHKILLFKGRGENKGWCSQSCATAGADDISMINP